MDQRLVRMLVLIGLASSPPPVFQPLEGNSTSLESCQTLEGSSTNIESVEISGQSFLPISSIQKQEFWYIRHHTRAFGESQDDRVE